MSNYTTNNFSACSDFNGFMHKLCEMFNNSELYINEDGYIVFSTLKESCSIKIVFKGNHKISVEIEINRFGYFYKKYICADSCISIDKKTKDTVYMMHTLYYEIIDNGLNELKATFYDEVAKDSNFASTLPKEVVQESIVYFCKYIYRITEKVNLNHKHKCSLEEVTKLKTYANAIYNLEMMISSGKD